MNGIMLKEMKTAQNEKNFVQNETNFAQNEIKFAQNEMNFAQNEMNFAQNEMNFVQKRIILLKMIFKKLNLRIIFLILSVFKDRKSTANICSK